MHEIKVTVVEFGDRPHYQMQWKDPITGRKKTKSTGVERTGRKKERDEAERVAAKHEADLREGRYQAGERISWESFRERYEAEVLPSLAPRTAEPRMAVFNHVERIISPKRLADLTAQRLSYFQSKLREPWTDEKKRSHRGLKETTIAGQLAHLQAALAWAKSMGMLRAVPNIEKPKRAKGQTFMRGRPVTGEEFDRMLAAVPKVRRHDAAAWEHYLSGLWLSGLRLEESLKLSWEFDGELMIDLSGKHPRLRIWAEAEKGHQDRLLPLTPDFAEWLLQAPTDGRQGLVFNVVAKFSGKTMSPKRVSRVVSAIGEKAGVVVNKAEGKFASCHDLRRSFGTRWASRVKPATLQLLMRHATIETTLRYYVAQDADEVAAELWREHAKTPPAHSTPPDRTPSPQKNAP